MKMKKYLTPLLISFSIVVGSLLPLTASAIDVFSGACGGSGSGTSGTTGTTGTTGTDTGTGTGTSSGGSDSLCGTDQDSSALPGLMKNVINTALVVLGMIAVVMIVVGGIRYTTSNGDAQQIKSAKDTIMYSVIGVVVAIMAYAIVNFVLASFKS